MNFSDLARTVFDSAGALDDVAVFESYLVAGEEPEETFGRSFFVVTALDPDLTADLEAAFAQLGQVRVHRRAAVVQHASAHHFVPVGQHQFDGVQHGHGARCAAVQCFAQAAFER